MGEWVDIGRQIIYINIGRYREQSLCICVFVCVCAHASEHVSIMALAKDLHRSFVRYLGSQPFYHWARVHLFLLYTKGSDI